jgi:putative ABC transport system permease protein
MTFARDLRVAVRSLCKSRAFALTAVSTLALGMTLCMMAMAVAKAYLLSDLPYPAAQRLVDIRYGAPGQPQPQDMEELNWSSLDDTFEHQIAWDLDVFFLIGGEQAESIPGAWVTPGFMQGLGVVPAVGRAFDSEAFVPGAANVALISHRLWQGRFGADPGIVGRTFTAYVSDRPQEAERFTVIGVLPATFWHVNSYTDILAPLRAPTYPYMARLRAGVTLDEAASRITTLVTAGARSVPAGWRPQVVRSHELYVRAVRPILRPITAAAWLVLLVGCANVAGLLLVRATGRQREIAVRTALGAGRAAIGRMLLAESLVLGSAATLLAYVATRLTLAALAPLVQQQLGRRAPAGVQAFATDAWMLAFAAGLGAATVLVCTLTSMLTAGKPGVLSALQSGGRTATAGRRAQRVRAGLIALEIAASLALLAGSTLLLRSVAGLLKTDLGFAADRVLLASVTLRQNRYPDVPSRVAAFDRISSQLARIPGSEAVGLTTAWPVQQPRMLSVESAGAVEPVTTRAGIHRVNDMYFAALRIPIMAGRVFTATDRPGSAPVALVSASLARQVWPGSDAVGKYLTVPQEQNQGEPIPVPHTIVGIVADVRQGPADVDLADVYTPLLQATGRFTFVLMRTAGPPANWLEPFRWAFREIDPELSVQTARPLQIVVDELTARPRFLAWLLGGFALTSALLALVGVYGVIAYAVRQREREIAVRMALGADAARLTRLFVQQGGRILIAGLGMGVLGALAAGRLIESQLFGVTARDPLALASAVAAFAAAGLIAIWWPSRNAARTDPAVALRAE